MRTPGGALLLLALLLALLPHPSPSLRVRPRRPRTAALDGSRDASRARLGVVRSGDPSAPQPPAKRGWWPWSKDDEPELKPLATDAGAGASRPLPPEERFLKDVKWLLVLLSGEARRWMSETGDLPPEIVQALLDDYQLLYLFRDMYNDLGDACQVAKKGVRDFIAAPFRFAADSGGRTYEALRAGAFETYMIASLILEGSSRRLLSGQARARRRRRLRLLGPTDRPKAAGRPSATGGFAYLLRFGRGKDKDEDAKEEAKEAKHGGPAALAALPSAEPKVKSEPATPTAPEVAAAPTPPPQSPPASATPRTGSDGRPQRIPKDALKRAFAVFDENDDGGITVAEMRRVLKAVLGRSVSRREAAEVIEIADANGDGKVDFAEFAEVMDAARLLNPDRIIYGDGGGTKAGGGDGFGLGLGLGLGLGGYGSLLVKDNFRYEYTGIKGKVADVADEVGEVLAAVVKESTLPDPPLLDIFLRWRRFQRIRRSRVQDNIRAIEEEKGAGLKVWRQLQTYPGPLREAMERSVSPNAKAKAKAKPKPKVKDKSRPKALKVEPGPKMKPSVPKRIYLFILNTARGVLGRRKLVANENQNRFFIVGRGDYGGGAAKKPGSGFGVTRDGRAMDARYRRLVAAYSGYSPSTIRSFQRATDRWRDGHISTPAYVRSTQSLFGSLAPRLLRPIAANVPERVRGSLLAEAVDRLEAVPVEATSTPAEPEVPTVSEPKKAAKVKRERRERKKKRRRWRRRRDQVEAVMEKKGAVAEPKPKPKFEAEPRRKIEEPPVVDVAPKPRRSRSEILAERCATAISKSAVVGFTLRRKLTGGELEILEIKFRVYLNGGLTARNLYDSVSVLVGDLNNVDYRIPDDTPVRARFGGGMRREKERAVDAILSAAMSQMPRDKQMLLKAVTDGVRQTQREQGSSQTTAVDVAQEVAEVVSSATLVGAATARNPNPTQ